jgi:hypothetical protein
VTTPARAREEALLADLDRVMGEAGTAEERRASLAVALTEALEADRCIIGTVDDAAVTCVAGLAPGLAGTPQYARLPIEQGIVGRAARERRTQRVDDVLKDPDYYSAVALTRSELAAPVLVDGAVRAMLNLESNRPAAFSAADARVLEAAARWVAERLEPLALAPPRPAAR